MQNITLVCLSFYALKKNDIKISIQIYKSFNTTQVPEIQISSTTEETFLRGFSFLWELSNFSLTVGVLRFTFLYTYSGSSKNSG